LNFVKKEESKAVKHLNKDQIASRAELVKRLNEAGEASDQRTPPR
jgi:hypothetical protein